LEAERLFDYSSLAPRLLPYASWKKGLEAFDGALAADAAGADPYVYSASQIPAFAARRREMLVAPRGTSAPVRLVSSLHQVSCADVRLAGSASPRLYGAAGAQRKETHGHSKKLVYVPQIVLGSQAREQAACQSHWSGIASMAPAGGRFGAGSTACATGCSAAGTRHLIANAGMFDQLNQALIASSFGRISLHPNVTVLDEVVLNPQASAKDDFLFYEQARRGGRNACGCAWDATLSRLTPSAPFLSQAAEAALKQQNVDYWLYMVLSTSVKKHPPPFPAWSNNIEGKGIVLTQCHASMYYAVHETGHRLGFRHSDVFVLNNALGGPHSPLETGKLATTGYSDQLDMMACCRSDYSLYYRTMAGWLSARERTVVSQKSIAAAQVDERLVLWPFDRPEARGRLMSVALRRSAGAVLLLGFRSASHWQDATQGGEAAAPSWLKPSDVRANVRGLTVEYVSRDDKTRTWGDKGLLDFNLLYRDWPDALPLQQNAESRQTQFALIRAGYSWYDAPSKLLLMVESIGECPGSGQAALDLAKYPQSALAFYGFRGEWPGNEAFQQGDYTGFRSLECLTLRVRSQASPPPAAPLGVRLRYVGSQLFLDWDRSEGVLSVTWQDAFNATLATSLADQVLLPGNPADLSLAEASRLAATGTSLALPKATNLARLAAVSAHVLAADGRHALLRIRLLQGSASAVLRRYGAAGIDQTQLNVLQVGGDNPKVILGDATPPSSSAEGWRAKALLGGVLGLAACFAGLVVL
ncbi:hypothetical protein H632_c1430p0, partial [Helicosporidium sp. ATCC 50920]